MLLQCVNLAGPSVVLPAQSSPPQLLPLWSSPLMAAQTHQSRCPRDWQWQQFSQSRPQRRLSGSSASSWRKSALWTGEEASFILAANHVIHIRERCMFPSFPTSLHPQVPACPGAFRRLELRRVQVVHDYPKTKISKCSKTSINFLKPNMMTLLNTFFSE